MNLPKYRIENIAKIFFLLGVFAVPISTALMNTFTVLMFTSFSIAFAINGQLRQAVRFAPAVFAVSLFALFGIGMVWSITPFPEELWSPIWKYSKLLLIPIGIALAIRDDFFAKKVLLAFIAGIAFSTFCTYLAWQELMPTSSRNWWTVGVPENPTVFKNYITFGVLAGFAGLICFNYAAYALSIRKRILSIAFGIYFLVPIVFLTPGRTGYVVIFIGMIALIGLRARNSWKMMVFGAAAVVIAFAGLFAVSDNMWQRVNLVIYEAQMSPEARSKTSTGIRFEFFRGGLELIAENPIIGLGTGSFSEGFSAKAKQIWAPGSYLYNARHQPHSEVILIGTQLGVTGLFLYFCLLGSLVWGGLKSKTFEGDVLIILVAVFATGSIFNSFLWDTTEGHWFTLLAGCLFGYARKNRINNFQFNKA